MDYLANHKFWLENEYFDRDTREELARIKDNPREIEERFYKNLEFGTGGLRGIMGAGTNRMNIYTVRKASQGVAAYVAKQGEVAKNKGIVIAFDSRSNSPEFAMEAARIFTGNGIKTYLFDELKPTPELSFAVRHLKAAAGIVVTASHNPKEYNGYKVYGADGAQLSLEDSNTVLEEMENLKDITRVNLMDRDEALKSGRLQIVGKEIDDAYIQSIKTLSLNPEAIKACGNSLKIVYTPLHGTGNKPVRRTLKEMGFENIIVVKEQELPDPAFSTVKSPNPEDKNTLTLAIGLAVKEGADLVIATDPDSDRAALAVKNPGGEFILLTGNQVGCLLQEYILSQKKAKNQLPANGFVVKTIVSTEFARTIADSYGIELVEVLTGFKFIGEQIKLLDEEGDKKYLFGFEESIGYLAGTFARDKDGVVASMLIAEMAAYFKTRNMTVYDGLEELYKKYGYSLESLSTFGLEGIEGLAKIKNTMARLRKDRMETFNTSEVKAIRDYETGERIDFSTGEKTKLTLPESDVLYYEMKDGSWFCIRPSGTEPKIKIYYGVSDVSREKAEAKMGTLKGDVLAVIKELLG